MQKFKVRVTHIGRYEREIVLEVEAEDMDEAVHLVEDGVEDLPAFDDPGWKTSCNLQNEVVVPVYE